MQPPDHSGPRPDANKLRAKSREWSTLLRATESNHSAWQAFATRYLEVIRDYLSRRWRTLSDRARIDDAVQDVFVDFLRPGGAFERLDPDRTISFRAFLIGVTHKVALRHERQARIRNRACVEPFLEPDHLPAETKSPDHRIDRRWARDRIARAKARMSSAANSHRHRRRIELLALRYEDGLPIREIATRWSEDPAYLHHEHAVARDEFRRALRAEMVAVQGHATAVDRRCQQLLSDYFS